MVKFIVVALALAISACQVAAFLPGMGGPAYCPPYQCPNGNPNPVGGKFDPIIDGCGQLRDLAQDKSYDFTNCCNKHDLCYGTCGSDKANCDQEFKACANRQCSREEKKAECRSTVSYYMIGLKMVGCPMFTSAQEAACDCARGDEDEM